MPGTRLFVIPLLLFAANAAVAKDSVLAQPLLVEHHDAIEVDKQLTLAQLIAQTVEKYPDRLINEALRDEADALKTRGDSWLAGSTHIKLDYSDDRMADDLGQREMSAGLQFTVWMWGQRAAAQAVAEGAQHAAEKQATLVRLEICRLVREALWDIALTEMGLEHARYTMEVSKKLLQKVERQVELGDLARADLLLAQSEQLQTQSEVAKAEAETMHARKSFISLTQQHHLPANYQEPLSAIDDVPPTHPALEAINALLERKQAAVRWAQTTDTINQPKIEIGAKSSRDGRGGIDHESAGVSVEIPIGHSTFDAPEIAAAALELSHAKAEREHLHRLLEKNLHEAKHQLEITERERVIANELKTIAESHLKMMELSFSVGEINLLDLLKVQARTMGAIRYAKEQEIKWQRDIALYNQAVGVMP